MEKDSLNSLFQALCIPDNNCRREAEQFVLNMINEQKIDFIEKIIYELNNMTPSSNQICYSFLIIEKYVPFYNDFPKVIQVSFKYFGNENEQVRIFSAETFCRYSIKSLLVNNDDTPINLLIALYNSTNDFNTLSSCIHSIATIMINIPNEADTFTHLCNFLFESFLKTESIELNTLFLLSFRQIIRFISDSYLSDERVVQKLFSLINYNEIKQYVYLLFESISDYFYSTNFFNGLILTIMEISCNDLSQVTDTSTLIKIISFWDQIATIEIDRNGNDVIYHYVDTCGQKVALFLLQLLLRKIDYNNDQIDGNSEWTPSQAAIETIKNFCLISPNLITPILVQFINESNDTEINFFILSILIEANSENKEVITQFLNFLNTIYSELQSSNVRVRYAALCCLCSFSALNFLPFELFQPFLSIFENEWKDVEPNVIKSFEIFANVCSKMAIEKQAENIIQIFQNIDQIPIQYLGNFLIEINRKNIQLICQSDDMNLIYRLISLFYETYVHLFNRFKVYLVVHSMIDIFDTFLSIPDLSLPSLFAPLLNILMKTFSEYSMPNVLITISRLFLADQENSVPYIPSVIQFFITVLNNDDNDEILTLMAVVSLSSMICVEKAYNFIDDIYNCMKNKLVNYKGENVILIENLIGFFQSVVLFRPIDDETILFLFKMIQHYFSLPDIEIDNINEIDSDFLPGMIDFLINFVQECQQSRTQECLQIINFVINATENLKNKPIDLYNKVMELNEIRREVFNYSEE